MEPILHYTSVSHADSVMASVNKMRLDSDLCDVVVVVGNNRIQAHGIILAASAPFLYQLSKTTKNPTAVAEYNLQDVDETAALKVIEFCYTSAISVDEESLWSVFVAATKLGCKEVIDLCSQLLTTGLEITTCVRTHLMAAALNNDGLMVTTGQFVAENIDMVCSTDTFLCLTSQEVLELVASLMCLQVKEEQLLKLIRGWLDHDVDGRTKLVMQLMNEFPSFADNLQKYLISDLASDEPQSVAANREGYILDSDKIFLGRSPNDEDKSLCATKYHSSYGGQHPMFREVPLYICVSCGEAFDGQCQLSQHLQECSESVHARNGVKDKQVARSKGKVDNKSDDLTQTSGDVVASCNRLDRLGDVRNEHSIKASVTANHHQKDCESFHSGKYGLSHMLEFKHSGKEHGHKRQRKDKSFIPVPDTKGNEHSSSAGCSEGQISPACRTRSIQFSYREGDTTSSGINDSNNNYISGSFSSDSNSESSNTEYITEKYSQLVDKIDLIGYESDLKVKKTSTGKDSMKDSLSHVKLQNVLRSKGKFRLLKLKCNICGQAFNERSSLASHKKLAHSFVEDASNAHSHSFPDGHGTLYEYRNKNRQNKGNKVSKIIGHNKASSDHEVCVADKSYNFDGSQFHLSEPRDGTAKPNVSMLKHSHLSNFTQWCLEQGPYFCKVCAAHHPKDSVCPYTMAVCKNDQNKHMNEIDKVKKEPGYDTSTMMDVSEDPLVSEKIPATFYSNMFKSHHSALDLSNYYPSHNNTLDTENNRDRLHLSTPFSESVPSVRSMGRASDLIYCPFPGHSAPHGGSVKSSLKLSADHATCDTAVDNRDKPVTCICPLGSIGDMECYSPIRHHVNSLSVKRKPASRQGFPCSACNRVFTYQAALLTHIQTHSLSARTYQCHLCQQSFAHAPDLKVHVCPNGVEKPYTCPNCDQTFAKNIHLKRHLATHSGIKPYPCWICGKRFSRSDHLKRHTQSLHAGSRPHVCLTCGKEFVRKYELNKHVVIHSADFSGSSC